MLPAAAPSCCLQIAGLKREPSEPLNPTLPDTDCRSAAAAAAAAAHSCCLQNPGLKQKPSELSEDNWRNIFATNVDGVFHTVRAAYPLLKQSKHSKVVITSSIAGGA
jgi:NAD(P)-dependent dehydrogenase (short-subunit alcohol dehydrogenase family)